MGRHNREGRGQDQQGRNYEVSYQPDWLHQVKVTRSLENGRQSTKTLFRNPAPPEQRPGSRVRTRVTGGEPTLAFTIEIDDPQGVIARIVVETRAPAGAGPEAGVGFSIEAHERFAGRHPGGRQKT